MLSQQYFRLKKIKTDEQRYHFKFAFTPHFLALFGYQD